MTVSADDHDGVLCNLCSLLPLKLSPYGQIQIFVFIVFVYIYYVQWIEDSVGICSVSIMWYITCVCGSSGEKSSRGLMQWRYAENCTEALVCANHAQIPHPGDCLLLSCFLIIANMQLSFVLQPHTGVLKYFTAELLSSGSDIVSRVWLPLSAGKVVSLASSFIISVATCDILWGVPGGSPSFGKLYTANWSADFVIVHCKQL